MRPGTCPVVSVRTGCSSASRGELVQSLCLQCLLERYAAVSSDASASGIKLPEPSIRIYVLAWKGSLCSLSIRHLSVSETSGPVRLRNQARLSERAAAFTALSRIRQF